MSTSGVGVHSIGYVLPETRRTNDWWPPEISDRWKQRRKGYASKNAEVDTSTLGDGVKAAMAAIEELRSDPFLGVKERRVIDDGWQSSDIEVEAAERAIAAAGIDRSKIDLLLVHSMLPDDHAEPNACLIHHRLGLREQCFSMSSTAACNAFLMHMSIAEKMIRSGQAHYALLVHSSVLSPLLVPEMPLSTIFGDSAAAIVVGPVGEGRGILGQDHRTSGDYHNVSRIGAPERRWYDDGPCYLYINDGPAGHRMLLGIPDMGREVIGEALGQAGLKPHDVDFFASHQGTCWFRRVSQKVAGLNGARSIDTFEWTGSLSSANIPFICALATEKGSIKDGDVVAMYSGGGGITWSGLLLRWGT